MSSYTSESREIRIASRLRPLRVAFLVKHNDASGLLTAAEINTCVWGGRYNCIIPLFNKLPSAWKEQYGRSPNPNDYINGMLEAFEPDCLVRVNCQHPP